MLSLIWVPYCADYNYEYSYDSFLIFLILVIEYFLSYVSFNIFSVLFFPNFVITMPTLET